MNTSTAEIRQAFLDFFQYKKHQIINGSSLLPKNDTSLLFTNAGMNQFKSILLGFEKPIYSRVATAQYCMRAGGKHNDLENVGYTSYHHTLFEMLGNFSFGDYFKEEAIQYAWEFLTSKNWLNLKKDNIQVTVHITDKTSFDIWKNKIRIPPNRILQTGDKRNLLNKSDNFWQMSDTGPCGTCTEIFYYSTNNLKKLQRYVEIWNIVFIQFSRQISGKISTLDKFSVDTGMGLERISAILQGVESNYHIDIFQEIISCILPFTSKKNLVQQSLYVIADHVRASIFLINDGLLPSNEGRGYVLRRIIRRALLHGYKLDINHIFLHTLVKPVIQKIRFLEISDIFFQESKIVNIIKCEEEKFNVALKQGLIILKKKLKTLTTNILDGNIAFLLYDTYGFPLDMTIEICQEKHIKVDISAFNSAMQKQCSRSKGLNKLKTSSKNIQSTHCSYFLGYDYLEASGEIKEIFIDNIRVKKIQATQKASLILSRTPFYAESGGQIGDTGEIKGKNFIFIVEDTQKYLQAIAHIGTLVQGEIQKGEKITSFVNKKNRYLTAANHSAVHLLYGALRQVLGSHVLQKGSLINKNLLRFDFSHPKCLKKVEINKIEDIVNEQIFQNKEVSSTFVELAVAKNKCTVPLIFDNKYTNSKVRLLEMGNFSKELCCGTHVSQTGKIGIFYISQQKGIASGVRRIEGITRENIIGYVREKDELLFKSAQVIRSSKKNFFEKISYIVNKNDSLKKEISFMHQKLAITEGDALIKNSINIKGTKLVLSIKTLYIHPEIAQEIMKYLKKSLHSRILILAVSNKKKNFLTVNVSKNIVDQIQAVKLAKLIIKHLGGTGGGNLETAYVGGDISLSSISSILQTITEWITKKL